MGNLECKEQGLLWESPTTIKGNSGRGVGDTGHILVGFSFSRKSLKLGWRQTWYCATFWMYKVGLGLSCY